MMDTEEQAAKIVEATRALIRRTLEPVRENVGGLIQRADKQHQRIEELERRIAELERKQSGHKGAVWLTKAGGR
jgi:polyhydroxyalkanoate synthesis regulator phasin